MTHKEIIQKEVEAMNTASILRELDGGNKVIAKLVDKRVTDLHMKTVLELKTGVRL